MQFFKCTNKNTKLNLIAQTMEAIDQLKQRATKVPLRHQVKQPPILFEKSAESFFHHTKNEV